MARPSDGGTTTNPPGDKGHGELGIATGGPWDPVGILWTIGDTLNNWGNTMNAYAGALWTLIK